MELWEAYLISTGLRRVWLLFETIHGGELFRTYLLIPVVRIDPEAFQICWLAPCFRSIEIGFYPRIGLLFHYIC